MTAELCEDDAVEGFVGEETHWMCSKCGDAFVTETEANECTCINEPKNKGDEDGV